jgi:biotin carboxyl carrier protein
MLTGRDEGPVDMGWGDAGEHPGVSERVVVAPGPGRFEPAPAIDGPVTEGQLLGEVVRSDTRLAVRAHTPGRFMGHLAERGQRVRDGQPLAWIRPAC